MTEKDKANVEPVKKNEKNVIEDNPDGTKSIYFNEDGEGLKGTQSELIKYFTKQKEEVTKAYNKQISDINDIISKIQQSEG